MKFRFKLTDLTAALVMIFAAAVFFVNDSTAQGKTYRIGDKGPAGGWVFYDKGSSDGGWLCVNKVVAFLSYLLLI